jgi:hypothetical protein
VILTTTSVSKARRWGLATRLAIGIVHSLLLTRVESALSQAESVFQLASFPSTSIRYEVIAIPPSLEGASQERVTPPVPEAIVVVALPIVEGVVAARIVAGSENSPQPHLFLAMTLKE